MEKTRSGGDEAGWAALETITARIENECQASVLRAWRPSTVPCAYTQSQQLLLASTSKY